MLGAILTGTDDRHLNALHWFSKMKSSANISFVLAIKPPCSDILLSMEIEALHFSSHLATDLTRNISVPCIFQWFILIFKDFPSDCLPSVVWKCVFICWDVLRCTQNIIQKIGVIKHWNSLLKHPFHSPPNVHFCQGWSEYKTVFLPHNDAVNSLRLLKETGVSRWRCPGTFCLLMAIHIR